MLQSYSISCRSESETMAFGMHSLRGLFDIEGLSTVRRAGLALVRRSWTLKDMFLQRAAGVGGNAPKLAKGTSLQELMQP